MPLIVPEAFLRLPFPLKVDDPVDEGRGGIWYVHFAGGTFMSAGYAFRDFDALRQAL